MEWAPGPQASRRVERAIRRRPGAGQLRRQRETSSVTSRTVVSSAPGMVLVPGMIASASASVARSTPSAGVGRRAGGGGASRRLLLTRPPGGPSSEPTCCKAWSADVLPTPGAGGSIAHEPALRQLGPRRRGPEAAPRGQCALRRRQVPLPQNLQDGSGRPGEATATLRHHLRMQRLAGATGAPVRRRVRGALRGAPRRERHVARGGRNAPVRGRSTFGPRSSSFSGTRAAALSRPRWRQSSTVPRRSAGSRCC